MTILNNRQWSVDVNNKPKLLTYILFKSDLNLEDYVKYHMHKRHRSLFAQFRVGILPLYIETGRYDNTPLATRICKLCDSDALEDEFHFLAPPAERQRSFSNADSSVLRRRPSVVNFSIKSLIS